MSLFTYDPSLYQKPAAPRRNLYRTESVIGDEKLVEVQKIRADNAWGHAEIKRKPKIEVTRATPSAESTLTSKFSEWVSQVSADVGNFVDGKEDTVELSGPSNFQRVAHIGWDKKKVRTSIMYIMKILINNYFLFFC